LVVVRFVFTLISQVSG